MPRIASRFTNGLEGWKMEGDPSTFEQLDTGGNPGGRLHWIDGGQGQDAYYSAGRKFLGDQSAFYGGKLSYDIYESGSTYAGVPDVELIGAGLTLVRAVGQPGEDWTHFSVDLTAKARWFVGTLDGPKATAVQIKAVLGDLDQLLIRAEYVSGGEDGGLDNVVLFKPNAAPAAPVTEAAPADAPALDHASFDGLVI